MKKNEQNRSSIVQQSMKAAVFLDRDGTINEEMGYINHPDRFTIFPFVPESIRIFNALDLKVIIITNQSGVARGYFTEELVKTIHQKLLSDLANQNASLGAIYYCPHHPTEGIAMYRKECTCRKPKPGMVEQAASEHGIDLSKSYMIGDRFRDIQFAKQIGLTSAMVLTGYGKGEYVYQRNRWPYDPDMIGENLLEIANIIRDSLAR